MDLPMYLASRTQRASNGCLVWTGARIKHVHGKVSGGYAIGEWQGKTRRMHRVVWEHHHGPIPPGITVEHRCHTESNCTEAPCDHRACLEITHLELLSRRDNTLAGRGITAANASKTQCPRGHPLDKGNLVTRKSGKRECRICAADGQRRRRQMKE